MHSQSLTDKYRGAAGDMNVVATTSAASLNTGIYEDPVDGAFRYYGVPGQEFGPLNVKYQKVGNEAGLSDESLVTKIARFGADELVADRYFGMELELDRPMTVTQLGQFDPGNNRGTYTLSLVRADDGRTLATVRS
jgi:hypothetical protein